MLTAEEGKELEDLYKKLSISEMSLYRENQWNLLDDEYKRYLKLTEKSQKYLLNNFFSIKYFNKEGLMEVSEITKIKYNIITKEYEMGNYLVGQHLNGDYYLFSHTTNPKLEIPFNEFLDRKYGDYRHGSIKADY